MEERLRKGDWLGAGREGIMGGGGREGRMGGGGRDPGQWRRGLARETGWGQEERGRSNK